MHTGEVEGLATGEHLTVNLTPARDPDRLVGGKLVEHGEVGEAMDVWNIAGGATQDIGFTTGEGASDGIEGLASHDKNTAHGGLFEPFEVFGQMPGDVAGVTDNAVFGHGCDGLEGLHGKSDGDGCLDGGVGIVVDQFEVLVGEAVNGFDLGVEAHLRAGAGLAGELFAGLVHVVGVEVQVAEGMDEFLGAEIAHLSDHHGQEGVGCDVEGDAEEDVGTALVELATEFAVGDIELEKGVTGRERHVLDFAGIPCANDVAAAVGVALEISDEVGDLVHAGAVSGRPVAPLRTVDPPEVAVFIGPFVPDGDLVIAQVGDIGFAFEEPEEFVNDGTEVKFFGGEEREVGVEGEACLCPKDGISAGAGAVVAVGACFKNGIE